MELAVRLTVHSLLFERLGGGAYPLITLLLPRRCTSFTLIFLKAHRAC